MEDVNKPRQIFLFLSKLEYGPLEINSGIRLLVTFSANWIKRDKVGKTGANSFLK